MIQEISDIELKLYYYFESQEETRSVIGNLIDANDYLSKSIYRLLEFEQILEQYKVDINS